MHKVKIFACFLIFIQVTKKKNKEKIFSRKLSALNIYKYIACILLGEEKYVQSSRSIITLITSANSPLACKAKYSQVPGIRICTSFGGEAYYSVYHRWIPVSKYPWVFHIIQVTSMLLYNRLIGWTTWRWEWKDWTLNKALPPKAHPICSGKSMGFRVTRNWIWIPNFSIIHSVALDKLIYIFRFLI